MLEVGRRCGLQLHGVGMPGHFLVGGGAGEWFDPFHDGARLDLAGCAELLRAAAPGTRFRPQFLMPVGPRAILQRMLGNLQHTCMQREPRAVVWVIRLRLRIPGISPLSQRGDLAGLLGRARAVRGGRHASSTCSRATCPGGRRAGGAGRGAAPRHAPTEPATAVPVAWARWPRRCRCSRSAPCSSRTPRCRSTCSRSATARSPETCLRGDGRFGVVLIERGFEVGGGDPRFAVGTVARIVEAARTPDGRYLLATVGTERLRVRKWLDDDPFPRAEIDVLAEPEAACPRRAASSARRRAAAARAGAGDERRARATGAERRRACSSTTTRCSASYEAAAMAPIGPLDAQRLIEIDDPAHASSGSRRCSTTRPRCSQLRLAEG